MSAPDSPAPKGANLPLTYQPVGTRIELSRIATMCLSWSRTVFDMACDITPVVDVGAARV